MGNELKSMWLAGKPFQRFTVLSKITAHRLITWMMSLSPNPFQNLIIPKLS